MDPLTKIFVYFHIRVSKRRIGKLEARNAISVILVFILLLFVYMIFQARDTNEFFYLFSLVVSVLLDLFFVYYWFSSSVVADQYLEHAKADEIMHTKYKLEEF